MSLRIENKERTKRKQRENKERTKRKQRENKEKTKPVHCKI